MNIMGNIPIFCSCKDCIFSYKEGEFYKCKRVISRRFSPKIALDNKTSCEDFEQLSILSLMKELARQQEKAYVTNKMEYFT